MNWLSGCDRPARAAVLSLALACIAACGMSDSQSADTGEVREYSVHYTLRPEPSAAVVVVELQLEQPAGLLRELSFPADPNISDITGDGVLQTYDGRVRWQPPATGGRLAWRATVHHERGDGTFDALLTTDWGIFRMEDIIPRARTRTLRGARSRTTMAFDLPVKWSAVTEYSAVTDPISVDRRGRRFDEPTGWMAVGRLGVRREDIAGTHVAVVGPLHHGVRRMDILALLNWTLPELNIILPGGLPRLTVVSAAEPMWRGGLSAPASFYLHADRPMISENATSSVLHEVMHVALGIRPAKGFDWIVEGLAEYYSIELLRRGRAITEERAVAAFAEQLDWSKEAETLCGDPSQAATTALAVTIFAALDHELRNLSGDAHDLDDLLPVLANREVSLDSLSQAATELVGEKPETLNSDHLPGCSSMS
ncbi:MAG: hypothetical protein P8Y01_10890 [Woeseiaceae bacterium]|jgi:hypothetical protein